MSMNPIVTADSPTHHTRPFRLRGMIAARLHRLAGWAEPFTRDWRWLPSAIAVGVLPVIIGFAIRSSAHQFVTALLLTGLCLPLVWRDAWWAGQGTIGVVFVTHSMVAIAVACHDPDHAALIFPQANDYWLKQVEWITTGVDAEYDWKNWVPAHGLLLAGTTLFSISSFGLVTFHHGLHEVDLMNYYNGRLLLRSQNGAIALLWGWHLWSILRGLAYAVLSYELIAISCRLFARRSLATWGTHGWRMGLGLTLILADGLAKYHLMEFVRLQLLHNMTNVES